MWPSHLEMAINKGVKTKGISLKREDMFRIEKMKTAVCTGKETVYREKLKTPLTNKSSSRFTILLFQVLICVV